MLEAKRFDSIATLQSWLHESGDQYQGAHEITLVLETGAPEQDIVSTELPSEPGAQVPEFEPGAE